MDKIPSQNQRVARRSTIAARPAATG